MAEIYINYGTNICDMAYSLMEKGDIKKDLYIEMKVLIKPNMVLPSHPSNGATTHSEVVEGIIRYLNDHSVYDITVGESSWVGERNTFETYKVCGFTELEKKYNIKLYDMKEDKPLKKFVDDREYYICESVEDYDYIINVPVLKGHCQTKITCCMKNLKGLIPDKEKRRYHTLGLEQPIADLNKVIKPDLNVIDSICGDLTFEEGGNPVQSERMLLGKDAVLLDSYCAGLLGYASHEIEYIKIAEQQGIGKVFNDQTVIDEPDIKGRPIFPEQYTNITKNLAKLVHADSSCSACYANLLFALHKLEVNSLSDLELTEKIKIGQGFKGEKLSGFGVGACTSGCKRNVKGCPPTALEIINSLTKTLP